MRNLIITTALVLVSIVTALAQEARPGSPIGGIVVKGGKNPRPKGGRFEIVAPTFSNGQYADEAAMAMPGQPIGGIVVKGGQNPRPKGSNFEVVDPFATEHDATDDEPQAFVAGNPIGGIIVKGGSNGGPNAIETNPLYNGSGTQGSNPLYKGKDR